MLFSNKIEKDIILKQELDEMVKQGLKVIYTLTRENNNNYENGRINSQFLKKHISNFSQCFYICGPITMVGELQHALKTLGAKADSIILES